MQWWSKKSFSIVILLIAQLLFASCDDQSSNTAQSTDSSKAIAQLDPKYTEDTTLINQGKSLFVNNCGACHSVFKTDNYLAGVVEKVGATYLKTYITKQDSLIKAKDKYALELKRVTGNLASVHNYRFTDDQLNAIIAFLRKYSP